MYCRYCGANNEANSGPCVNCGQQLQWQVQQPQSRPPAYPIKNYLVESILATLFCCVIPGIVGIIYAAQVNGLVQSGNYAAAEDSSKKAKNWTLASFILGLIAIPLQIISVIHNLQPHVR